MVAWTRQIYIRRRKSNHLFRERKWKEARGVGFIIEKATAKCVLRYNPINERIMTVRLQGHPMNISIIQVYAPTADAPEKEITDFYEMVQGVVDSIPKKDFLIIFGDWNAKIGITREKSEFIGNYGLGIRNERGDRLEEFCVANSFIIGNS
ncbi:craniofacial development protein 2-like [Strongylocentrotus purpuratus]|uniref:Craniofacial development protein 2-like n=1 Tax=Strongylocentrotus purpuratus TaxID=7668 RepID=A0A7M7N5G4_STRPU|nr:craniofacial development protein 2-like [Strongylocentrotus purpuratus]